MKVIMCRQRVTNVLTCSSYEFKNVVTTYKSLNDLLDALNGVLEFVSLSEVRTPSGTTTTSHVYVDETTLSAILYEFWEETAWLSTHALEKNLKKD